MPEGLWRLFESPLFALAIALFLGVLAVSGKFSQSAAHILLVGVWITGSLAMMRSGLRDPRLLTGSVLVRAAICFFTSYWIHPARVPPSTEQAPVKPEQQVSPSESAQIMISKIVLVPATNSKDKSTVQVFLDNRGKLAAEDWTVNTATTVSQHRQTQIEEQGGVAAARTLLTNPIQRQHIQPGDLNVPIFADEPKVTVGLQMPFYYYVYVCVVYRDKAHERQQWVTEYGAFALNEFEHWHPFGNRRIFLEDDAEQPKESKHALVNSPSHIVTFEYSGASSLCGTISGVVFAHHRAA